MIHLQSLQTSLQLFKVKPIAQQFYQASFRCATTNASHMKQQLNKFSGGAVHLNFVGPSSGFAEITVNNPSKKNAFTGSMCVQLREIIDELQNWPYGRGVILTGSNGMFCAGADLTMMREITDKQSGENFSQFMQAVACDLRHLPVPTLALVRDHVYGGGAELMVSTDFQLASPETKICFVQGKNGITTGWGGATHLVNKVGENRALEILLSGRVIETAEALSLNLITSVINEKITSEQSFLDAGLECLDKLYGRLSPVVIQGMKSVCVGASVLPYKQSIDNERSTFLPLWGGKDHLVALGIKPSS